MQIVIDISKRQYEWIKKHIGVTSYRTTEMLYDSVRNSTPLPNGHGDLKDMDNLKYVFDLTKDDHIYSGKDIEQAVKSMKTIVPKDKDGSTTNLLAESENANAKQ